MSWIAVGVAVVGAGASYASSKQQSKATRNQAQETKSIPFSQQRKQARQMALTELQLQPFYANNVQNAYRDMATLQRNQQQQGAEDMMRQLPAWAQRERQLTRAQRAGDVQDYQQMMMRDPSMQSMQAVGMQAGQSSPLLRLLNGDAAGLLGGRSQIGGELESQAIADLQLGRGLSEQEQRDAEQSARGAWASRGLAFSNGAVGAEILNRDAYGRQRQDQRRAFAGGVQGMLQSEDESRQRYGMGVQSLNAADLTSRAQVANMASQPMLNILGQRATSPYASLNAAYQTAMPIGAASNILSQAPSVFQGASALTPLYNYQQDVANTNLNKSASDAAAQANLYANIGGAALSTSGRLAEAQMKKSA